MSEARKCLRAHYYRFEVGITKEIDARALRMGTAIHLGLELRGQGRARDEALEAIRQHYQALPDWALDHLDEWTTECETVVALIAGYYWRYESDDIEIIENEQRFRLPIRNPETGAVTPCFDFAGKYDKYVRMATGAFAILEHKTCGESIEPDAEYWRRLRIDTQISGYLLGARETGRPAETVLYDVIRKPSIRRMLATPTEKRRYTKAGDLYSKQRDCDETPHEFGWRLLDDISNRPDFYYARREIPRLESDLDDFRAELWQQQRHLRECQKSAHWFRNVTFYTCPYCQFKEICYENQYPLHDETPDGFVKLGNVHPELEDLSDDNTHANQAD